MRKKNVLISMLVLIVFCLNGCRQNTNDIVKAVETRIVRKAVTEVMAQMTEAREEWQMLQEEREEEITISEEEFLEEQYVGETEILNFVDVFGEEYQVEINPNVKKHEYELDAFSHNDYYLSYIGDERYSYRNGIDVSHHQGVIDWEKVKSAGYEFAFLRIGYRGYGELGKICLDRCFFDNIKNAQAVGIDVGVYFFSQAINEEEAREEAEFVLKNLEGYELQLPVVYDPESILDAPARTDDVTGEQFTRNTIVFCEMVKNAGYEPMIYSNMLWESYQFDLENLANYSIWYADYEPLPQTPYNFVVWQYTNTARIDGVNGDVDLDIQLIPIQN